MDDINKALLDNAYLEDVERITTKIRQEELHKITTSGRIMSEEDLQRKVEKNTNKRVQDEQVKENALEFHYGEFGGYEKVVADHQAWKEQQERQLAEQQAVELSRAEQSEKDIATEEKQKKKKQQDKDEKTRTEQQAQALKDTNRQKKLQQDRINKEDQNQVQAKHKLKQQEAQGRVEDEKEKINASMEEMRQKVEANKKQLREQFMVAQNGPDMGEISR